MARRLGKQTVDIDLTVMAVQVNDIEWNDWYQIKVANQKKLVVENVYDTDTITYSGTV